MTEFRIYYEALEQAHDYILPIARNAIHNGVNIQLVKSPRGREKLALQGRMSGIYGLTTPDILITGINENIEYPLVVMEFSEAVITEDHELQRLNGAVAAFLASCFYVKISGEKQSDKEFGGAEYNIFSTTRIMRDILGYAGCIIARWPTEPDALDRLRRDSNFPSVPPPVALVNDVIEKCVTTFLNHPTDWFARALAQLQQTKSFLDLISQSDNAPTLPELFATWQLREQKNIQKNSAHRTRFFVREDALWIKIYRWTHAMDSDRGIITILSAWVSEQRQIYGVYNIARKSNRMPLQGLEDWRQRFLETLVVDTGGVPTWFVDALKQIADEIKSLKDEYDVTSLWQQHRDAIKQHNVLGTLFLFTDGMFLGQGGPKLKWDRFAELGASRSEFMQGLTRAKLFDQPSAPTRVELVTKQVDEDEVTYALVHRVLRPNHFHIVAVSYPAAQGSTVILPDPSSGLSQKRYYPDVVALVPTDREERDVLLGESKGMFSRSSLESVIPKLTRYLAHESDRDALKDMLIRARVIDPEGKIQDVLIGVAFGTGLKSRTDWQPARVDFIFRIVNRDKWAIGIFRQKLKELIPIIEGETLFPECYRVATRSTQSLLPGLAIN